MGLIHRIFGQSDAAILCPRCEKPLEGHSDADCARKMSRRLFLGATLGAVAAAVVIPEIVTVEFSATWPMPIGPIPISRHLYRIPLQLFRGGHFRKYNADTGDLGTGGWPETIYEIVDADDPRVAPSMKPIKP